MAAGLAITPNRLPPEVRAAVARGWRLLPVKARGKTPLVQEWPKAATDAPERLETWAAQFPGCNWGIATGPDSGVWVLDVDGEQGRASLAELEAEHRQLPATLSSRTGREAGGEHRWFTWPGDYNIRNSTSKLAPGLDVKGEGGYVVIPPSVHPSGRPYQWADPDATIADAPLWLLDMLTTPAPRLTRTPAAEIGIFREGQRNDGLIRLAGARRRKGATEGELQTELLEANARRCLPPLSDAEVLKIAASAARYPVGGPDPLESAWAAIQEENYPSKYSWFVALSRQLQLARIGQPIALPLERIGGLMGCDWTQVRRWRKRAVSEGLLQLSVQHIPHRRASLYLFTECPSGAVSAKHETQCPTRIPVPLGPFVPLSRTSSGLVGQSTNDSPNGTLAESRYLVIVL